MRFFLAVILAVFIAACSSAPQPRPDRPASVPRASGETLSQTRLPDYAAFYQKDKRWGHEKLGPTRDTMASDGCLVTAAAMALANLGFETDPSDLNKRLTHTESFTSRGWLIWDGIRRVTGGQAVARFYDSVDADKIEQCMADGFYPLVQFYLPNGRSHWAMVLDEAPKGYLMRDPLRRSATPLIFPQGIEKFRALRCVGLA